MLAVVANEVSEHPIRVAVFKAQDVARAIAVQFIASVKGDFRSRDRL
jgi:hypothetical protein